MEPKFAKRIADQLNRKKWQHGWKPPAIAKWIMDRFPALTQEDQAQIASYLPKK